MSKPRTPDTIYVSYIVAAPEKVWQALTNPEFTEKFFFGRTVESDWKQGSPWLLRMPDGRVDVEGRVLESETPRRLRLSWRVVWVEEWRHLPESIVTYEIEPLGEMVRLTMTESHPEPIDEKYLEGGRAGWPVILSGLKSLLETGRALPEFDPSSIAPPEVKKAMQG